MNTRGLRQTHLSVQQSFGEKGQEAMNRYQDKLSHHKAGQRVAQVAQRGYENSVFVDIRILTKQGPITKAEVSNTYKL